MLNVTFTPFNERLFSFSYFVWDCPLEPNNLGKLREKYCFINCSLLAMDKI